MFYDPIIALVKRGFLHSTSYRLAFTITILNSLLGVLSYYYLAQLIQSGNPGLLDRYGGNAAAFLIVGTTFNTFVGLALRSFSGSIQSEQMLGIFEQWYLSRTPVLALVIYSTFWEFLWPLLTSVFTFAVLALGFGVAFDINWITTLTAFALSMLALAGLGLVSAAFVVVAKRGDPMAFVWTTLSGLLSGVFYPVEILPGWLQSVASVLPTTHALAVLREATINGAELTAVGDTVLLLLLFAVVTIPTGIFAFLYAFERARREGSLSQY